MSGGWEQNNTPLHVVQSKFHTCSTLCVPIFFYITMGPAPLALLPYLIKREKILLCSCGSWSACAMGVATLIPLPIISCAELH